MSHARFAEPAFQFRGPYDPRPSYEDQSSYSQPYEVDQTPEPHSRSDEKSSRYPFDITLAYLCNPEVCDISKGIEPMSPRTMHLKLEQEAQGLAQGVAIAGQTGVAMPGAVAQPSQSGQSMAKQAPRETAPIPEYIKQQLEAKKEQQQREEQEAMFRSQQEEYERVRGMDAGYDKGYDAHDYGTSQGYDDQAYDQTYDEVYYDDGTYGQADYDPIDSYQNEPPPSWPVRDTVRQVRDTVRPSTVRQVKPSLKPPLKQSTTSLLKKPQPKAAIDPFLPIKKTPQSQPKSFAKTPVRPAMKSTTNVGGNYSRSSSQSSGQSSQGNSISDIVKSLRTGKFVAWSSDLEERGHYNQTPYDDNSNTSTSANDPTLYEPEQTDLHLDMASPLDRPKTTHGSGYTPRQGLWNARNPFLKQTTGQTCGQGTGTQGAGATSGQPGQLGQAQQFDVLGLGELPAKTSEAQAGVSGTSSDPQGIAPGQAAGQTSDAQSFPGLGFGVASGQSGQPGQGPSQGSIQAAQQEQLSEAEKQRREFFSYVGPDQYDAALALWKEAKRLEKSEGAVFDWSAGPMIVFEQVADIKHGHAKRRHMKQFRKGHMRKAMFVDMGMAFVTNNPPFSAKEIVKSAIEENEEALELEFSERPPPPPALPTRTIAKDCLFNAMEQVVESLQGKNSKAGGHGGAGKVKDEASTGRMGQGGVGSGQAGQPGAEGMEDSSALGQFAKSAFGFLKQAFGVQTKAKLKAEPPAMATAAQAPSQAPPAQNPIAQNPMAQAPQHAPPQAPVQAPMPQQAPMAQVSYSMMPQTAPPMAQPMPPQASLFGQTGLTNAGQSNLSYPPTLPYQVPIANPNGQQFQGSGQASGQAPLSDDFDQLMQETAMALSQMSDSGSQMGVGASQADQTNAFYTPPPLTLPPSVASMLDQQQQQQQVHGQGPTQTIPVQGYENGIAPQPPMSPMSSEYERRRHGSDRSAGHRSDRRSDRRPDRRSPNASSGDSSSVGRAAGLAPRQHSPGHKPHQHRHEHKSSREHKSSDRAEPKAEPRPERRRSRSRPRSRSKSPQQRAGPRTEPRPDRAQPRAEPTEPKEVELQDFGSSSSQHRHGRSRRTAGEAHDRTIVGQHAQSDEKTADSSDDVIDFVLPGAARSMGLNHHSSSHAPYAILTGLSNLPNVSVAIIGLDSRGEQHGEQRNESYDQPQYEHYGKEHDAQSRRMAQLSSELGSETMTPREHHEIANTPLIRECLNLPEPAHEMVPQMSSQAMPQTVPQMVSQTTPPMISHLGTHSMPHHISHMNDAHFSEHQFSNLKRQDYSSD